jgi:hypothetical protein
MGNFTSIRKYPLESAPTGSFTTELPETMKARLASTFGTDFSDVRMHVGGDAAQACQAMGARAFAYGGDVFFASEVDAAGAPLLMHELTHVVQQRKAQPDRGRATILKK